ncbi:MAG: polyprenyl synthetase family protein [Clostridiales bacterium]|nr:polyprenyl synthetase family protein [Clostridiales bacterium]
MNFKEELQAHTSEVERIITAYLPKEEGYQKTVMEAMNYSFLAGGKRLRPMLMLETYRLFAGSRETSVVEPFMAAIEMIHTSSLIHDDLPAMDNDEYRRGRKTTHIVYGEAMAILAGDGLLNLAFETALKALEQKPQIPPLVKAAGGSMSECGAGNDAEETKPDSQRVQTALSILARSTGIYGMMGGQVVDVESEGMPIDRDRLDFIYELKTGALINAAMLIGAVLGGADREAQNRISEAARNIGLAFQIQDDILDVIGDQAVLGKPVGSDQKNEKTTYVTLRGLEQSVRDVEVFSNRAIAVLEDLPMKNTYLTALVKYLIGREK